MKMINVLLAIFLLALSSCGKKTSTGGGGVLTVQPPQDKNWQFETTPIWQDEFNTDGAPDATKWGYELGGSGWGNNELEYYTDNINNAKVQSGNLVITAIKESVGGMNYTSARMLTKNKEDLLYGRVEVRAKLPSGRGTWPAIWMLPTDWAYGGWPASGEVDIMEHVGYDPNKVVFSIHTQAYNHSIGTQKNATVVIPTAMTEFHKYRVDWTPYAVRGYYDDQLMFTFVNDGRGYATWPFDKRFHILLNLAIGGNWGGAQGVDDTIFPTSLVIDYVRVYKMIP
jgi:beta-glucanase (GH16 family)